RLGRWAAGHPWRTLGAWAVLLAVVGTLAATIGQPLTSRVSIPGTEFERVVAQLGREIPSAAGGFGRVVLKSDTGAFTDAQKQAVREVIADWETVPHVQRVVDPFAAQQQLESSAGDLAAARTELDTAKAQVTAGRQQLDAAKRQLAGGEALLAQLKAQNPADPTIPGLEAQLAAGRDRVASGEKELAAGEAQYLAGEQQYRDGLAVRDASSGTRLVSEDGRVAVVQVQFDDNAQSVPAEDRALIPERADPVLAAAGVTPSYSVEITQELAFIGPGEILGLTVALLVLVITLGSLIAAGLPLLVALLGVGVGLGGAMAFTSVVEMNQTTPALALMLGLAVGIDYALFIVNRHRGNILAGMPVRESIARSVATAGSAVTFAGSTVVIALAALVLSGIPILAEMGVVAAVTVAVAVLVAVTVSPAVLRLMGTRVVSHRAWRAHGFHTPGDPAERAAHEGDPEEEHGAWFVRLVTRAPWLTVLGVVAVLGVIAIPAASMRLGLPDGGSEPTGSSAHTAYSTIADEFGPGMNGPVVAVATLPSGDAPRTDAEVLHEQAVVVDQLSRVDGVSSVVPFGVSEDRTTLAFQVVPSTGPAEEQTRATLEGIQSAAGVLERHDGIAVGLTGQTVANIEISDRLAAALPTYLLVVVGLSLLILTVVFRSVVVPLVATGGFLLSVAAAFGLTVAVHQWGWLGGLFGVTQPGPLLSFMPIMLI
ncbi:MAG TPA: MMPL family transporter, partial [Phycicoccus sp.]